MKNTRKTIAMLSLVFLLSVFFASATNASVILFDIDADPGTWTTAVSGLTMSTDYNFDLNPNYGIAGFDGPLTSAGAGPVSPGILPDDILMDRINLGGTSPGLVAVGPGSGYGNTSNAILANFFSDAFSVDFLNPKAAYEFNALTLLGGNFVDITVWDDQGGSTIFGNVSVGSGHNLGILGTGGMNIASVDFYDFNGGAEGVQGYGLTYISSNVIPEPSTMLLLGVGLVGLAGVTRRKLKK